MRKALRLGFLVRLRAPRRQGQCVPVLSLPARRECRHLLVFRPGAEGA